MLETTSTKAARPTAGKSAGTTGTTKTVTRSTTARKSPAGGAKGSGRALNGHTRGADPATVDERRARDAEEFELEGLMSGDEDESGRPPGRRRNDSEEEDEGGEGDDADDQRSVVEQALLLVDEAGRVAGDEGGRRARRRFERGGGAVWAQVAGLVELQAGLVTGRALATVTPLHGV